MFHGYFFHPLHGTGYQFWSGIAGSFLTSIPGWLVAFFLFIRARNCHVKGCKSFHTAVDPEHGWHACVRHHTKRDAIGVDPHQ